MKTLCIVPCGKRKIWDERPDAGPTPARDVYIGPFAAKCREYAERFCSGSWCILSAKHGFLWPDECVPGPYSVTFADRSSCPISDERLSSQVKQKGLDTYHRIVLVTGLDYEEPVRRAFKGTSIHTPLRGLGGIGYMLQALNRAIARGVPL